jgi:hypothetical protein
MSRLSLIVLMALALLIAVPAGAALAQGDVLEGEGTAVIWGDAALSDAVTFAMTGVTPPATGTAYEGWLVSDDGTVKLSTGIITVGDDGSVNHSFDSNSTGNTGQNLIANYDKVLITVEPVPDSNAGPSGVVAFSAQIPAGAIAHIRHLLADWPPGSGVGILTNLQTNLEGAILHANLAKNSDTLALKVLHTRRVINAIEGDGGANYDASSGDPAGDGTGVLAHASDRKHAGFASATAVDNATIAAHAALVDTYGTTAELSAGLARDQALKVLASNLSLANIYLGPGANTVLTLLDVALNGIEGGDGGAKQAYVEAQLMATYELVPGAATTIVAPPPGTVGDPTIPLLAQIALIASVLFLGAGGLLALKGRRSRAVA